MRASKCSPRHSRGDGRGRAAGGAAALCESHERAVLCALAVAAVTLRCAVALHPHSGEGVPPMHGDFEAQRHWMEITTNLPILDWYENTTDNDLQYWGLDYPPLTAYHSYALGWVGKKIVPECFALHSSRGHESPACRLYMRATVVASDVAVYFPGALLAARGFARAGESAAWRVGTTALLWMHPALVIIDHGHFQYNGVCFGLCLAAAGLVARGRTVPASVLFTAALLFKQIALYYALAFFAGILADCVRPPRGAARAAARVAANGAAVAATAAALLAPWLASPAPGAAVGQVLHRMFPFARGLYEDKVANVWCTVSVVVKVHRLLPPAGVKALCAAATLAALAPACAYCLRRRAGAGAFAAALAASSLSFFLLAFQVHEKSVLFAAVAAALLPLAAGPRRRPTWAAAGVCHTVLLALFSMYPLLAKDRLHVAYAGLAAATAAAAEAVPAPPAARVALRGSAAGGALLHVVYAAVPPPARYPDAWTLLITGTSCAQMVLCLAALTAAQLRGAFADAPAAGAKAD